MKLVWLIGKALTHTPCLHALRGVAPLKPPVEWDEEGEA